jgi:ribose/xylose/arabinose/galactoside ABC-type transport system permease subunit
VQKVENPDAIRKGGIARAFDVRRGGVAIVYVILFAIIVFAAIVSPPFLSARNISNVLKQVTALGILSVGQTFVILLGGIDISVGAVISVVCCMNSYVMAWNGAWGIWLGVLASLAIGVIVGLINGLGVTKLKVSPFMMTLGMMSVLQGAAIALRGQPGGLVPSEFAAPITGNTGPVPTPILIFAAAAVVGYFILNRTLYGRRLFATGGNAISARLSGIRTERVIVLAYVTCSVMAAVAGIFITARIRTGDALVGTPFGLDSITAVAIGGTSMMGGRGGVIGTIPGAFMVTLLANILNLVGVSSFYQYILKGLLIIFAVSLYAERK